MGNRFYDQQKNYKPKRILKKDVIERFETIVNSKVNGLDRLTIKALEDLTSAVMYKISSVKLKKAYKELAK